MTTAPDQQLECEAEVEITITKDISVQRLKQPEKDYSGGQLICGPGIGPSGMQPRPNDLRKIMPKITRVTEDLVLKAKRFAMEQSASFVLFKQVERHVEVNPAAQVSQTQRTRIINLMSRIYITGLSPEVRDDSIRIAFTPFGAIRRVEMSYETVSQNKGFAFVEYEVPDSSELALDQMNNTMIAGRAIMVTRPSNASSTSAMIDNILDEARSYPRIFVANIHPEIHSRDLRNLFETFGRIRSCVILGERNPRHKGMAYIEFDDHSSANEAIVSMNMFELGKQKLRVGKAVTLASHLPEDKGLPAAAALAMAAVTAKLQGKDKVTVSDISQTTDKKSKEDSVLNAPPIDNLISAIISPAMVQAGLSDLAADLVTKSDIKALMQPGIIKSKTDNVNKKRFTKNKGFSKSETCSSFVANGEHKSDDAVQKKVEDSKGEVLVESSSMKTPPKRSGKSPSPRKTRRRSRSRNRRISRESYRRRSRSASKRSRKDETKRKHRNRHRSRSKSVPKPIESMLEDLSIKGNNARLMIMQKLARNLNSDVILLRNLVSADEVDNELKAELEQECAQYGTIKQVIINQERLGNAENSTINIKIFVQFSEIKYAEKAHAALNKRFFNGKAIRAEFYDKEKFEAKDYSH